MTDTTPNGTPRPLRDPAGQIALMERLSQRAAAWLVGCSVRNLRRLDVPRNDDGSYHAGDVFRARLEVLDDRDGADLAGDSDSPSLERWRAARADLAEMERDRLRGELVRLDAVCRSLDGVTARMRRFHEELARRGFVEPFDMFGEALDDLERGIMDLPARVRREDTT